MQLIQGTRDRVFTCGDVALRVVTRSTAPVRVLEEDTWRVLSAPARLPGEDEHPMRVMTDLVEQQPDPAGSLVVSGRRWYAILHDFDQSPSFREAWLQQALAAVLQRAAQEGLNRLALPLLGVMHGALPLERSLKLIVQTLRTGDAPGLHVDLEVGEDQLAEANRLLTTLCD
ncbi:MAG: hypothetical protein P8Y64_07740 [Gammaproteobacteria bacterium]|jgi:hypothetical protein